VTDDFTFALRAPLEATLAASFGAPRPIAKLDRRRCPFSSSFEVDELDVHVRDDSRLGLVIKHLGRDRIVDAACRARPEFLYDASREANVYRWILPHGPFGPARFYGELTPAAHGTRGLLLEKVEGDQLWQVGEVSVWAQAARWVASARAQELAARSGALVYDEAFYWTWLQRARRFAAGDEPKRDVLDRIAERYPAVVARLTALPPTLIHGEFYPSNIVIAGAATGPGVRVCAVDWELAALAPALIDLAALSAGWAAPIQRVLARAYLAAATDTPDERRVRLPREFVTDLDCCRLHLAVRMIGWSDEWQPPPDQAHDWIAEAAGIAERLPL
jgi:hypothetical protein